jgi:uncharacterized protein YehS (DUF1456 family)
LTNNDVLRRIRYAFDFKNAAMVEIFAAADYEVSTSLVVSWLKKDTDESYCPAVDMDLAAFLNGLINTRRGRRDGEQPEPETRLNNNMILIKLRIALNMKAEDMLETMQVAGFRLSKHELSAFFRKSDHKNYRECNDQILRNFLNGLQRQLRPADKDFEQSEEAQA